jgi:hypothetical protein
MEVPIHIETQDIPKGLTGAKPAITESKIITLNLEIDQAISSTVDKNGRSMTTIKGKSIKRYVILMSDCLE